MERAWLLFALVACAGEPAPIEYTGETRRFAVDSIALPKNGTEARASGLDLDGDRYVDNQLGSVIGTLNSFNDITAHGPDMIASGVLASSIEIIADDFTEDGTVAVRYFGRDGEHAELVGGELVDGAFTTEVPGTAIVHLPVFVDADPIVVRLSHVRVAMLPDGRGGFDARIGGTIDADEARRAALVGIRQMIEARPMSHVLMMRMLDKQPYDFMITQDEFDTSSLIKSLLAPDIEIDGKEMLSIGFRVHLSPCAEGQCVTAPPAAPCFDRVKDGDETDVDCGGSCGACVAGAECRTANDCESRACNAGTCAAPTCSDGVRDGHETDVDCGGPCSGCAANLVCWSDSDCASNQCGAPCNDGDWCPLVDEDICR